MVGGYPPPVGHGWRGTSCFFRARPVPAICRKIPAVVSRLHLPQCVRGISHSLKTWLIELVLARKTRIDKHNLSKTICSLAIIGVHRLGKAFNIREQRERRGRTQTLFFVTLVWLLFNDSVGFMSPAFLRIWRLLPIIGFAVKNFRAASGLPFGCHSPTLFRAYSAWFYNGYRYPGRRCRFAPGYHITAPSALKTSAPVARKIRENPRQFASKLPF